MLFRPLPILLVGLALSACAKAVKTAQAQQREAPLSSLEGSEWGPDTDSSSDMFVAFKAGGEVSGHGGCNRFFGSYELNGQNLTFGPLAATRMACPNLEEEQDFLNALQAARTIDATHIRLVLRGEDGTPVLTLRRRDWD